VLATSDGWRHPSSQPRSGHVLTSLPWPQTCPILLVVAIHQERRRSVRSVPGCVGQQVPFVGDIHFTHAEFFKSCYNHINVLFISIQQLKRPKHVIGFIAYARYKCSSPFCVIIVWRVCGDFKFDHCSLNLAKFVATALPVIFNASGGLYWNAIFEFRLLC